MQILTTMTWRHLNGENDTPTEHTVTLTYTPDDPCAVTIGFPNNVNWSVSRDLLAAGLLAPSGCGDVRLYPWTLFNEVEILFSNNSQVADFACPLRELDTFLAATFALVPADAEYADTDLDHALARWLEEAA